jgi:hypothetical protein
MALARALRIKSGASAMTKKTVFRVPLRIVFYREGKAWIAHCLEFDLSGDGNTKAKALQCLGNAILIQVEATLKNNNPANLFSPADGKYFEMFAAGADIADGLIEVGLGDLRFESENIKIETVEAREFEDLDAELAPL